MRRRLSLGRSSRPAALVAAFTLGLIVLGALLWFRPYLTRKTPTSVSEVVGPAALNAASQFAIPPDEQACMVSVAVEPNSLAAQFQLTLPKRPPGGDAQVEVVFSAPGYSSVGHLAVPYPGGLVSAPMRPPSHPLLATACLMNRGSEPFQLAASTEARTITRSPTTVSGAGVVGDVALTLIDTRPSSILGRLGTIFAHASNLTERLIPVWLIWVLAVLVALLAPGGIVLAIYLAIEEDERGAAGASPY